MKNEDNDDMGFGGKWFWSTYIRGGNPITAFIGGLIRFWYVPFLALGVFCLLVGENYFEILGIIFHFLFSWIGWVWDGAMNHDGICHFQMAMRNFFSNAPVECRCPTPCW